MAKNLTFSKNGVPMGRNKSTAENNSSRWTAQEDNYLKMALTATPPQGIQLFKIETGVPLPARNGRNEQARSQVRNIFNQIQIGQSFVVPKNMVHVAQYIVNKEFQSYKIRTSATSADKKFFRIYRVA